MPQFENRYPRTDPAPPAGPMTPPTAPGSLGGLDRWPWAARLAVFLVLISAARVLFVLYARVDLVGDEAQYWDWSRRPDWCYFSKGPMVAWCIWLSRQVFGETVLAIRLPAIVMSAISSVLLFLLGRRIYSERVGGWAAVLMQVTPLFAAYGIGMTIDPPFLMFWLLSLLLFHRAVAGNRWADWLGLGLAIGCGLLSKYTMAFFYPCALLYLLLDRKHRRRLIELRPWVAILLSLAFLVPLLVWNAQHGWINFQHNAGHARLGKGFGFDGLAFLNFVGGQFAVITPVLLPMMVYALLRQRIQDRFSFWFSVPILAFFLLMSLRGEVYANWTLPAFATGFLAFARCFITPDRPWNAHVRRLTQAACIIPAAATAVIMIGVFQFQFAYVLDTVRLPPKWAPMPPKWNPYRQMTGWDAVGREVARLRAANGGKDHCFIVAERRLVTARLGFYTPGQPGDVYQMRFDNEPIESQYHLWRDYGELKHWNAVCLFGEGDPIPTPPPADRGQSQSLARLKRHAEWVKAGKPEDKAQDKDPYRLWDRWAAQFASVDEGRVVVAHGPRNYPVRSATLYVCHDYLGRPTTEPD